MLVSMVRDGHPLAALQATTAGFARRRCVSISPRLRYTLDTLLNTALRKHGTDLGNIQLIDSKTGSLAIVAQRGVGVDFLEHFAAVSAEDESACGRAMRTQNTIVIPDVTIEPSFMVHRSIALAVGVRAVQSEPLINRNGALLGVISTHFRSLRQPDAQLHRLNREHAACLLEPLLQ